MLTEILQTYVLPIALRLLLAAVIWMVGRWLARRAQDGLAISLEHTALTESFIVLFTRVAYFGILLLAGLLALAAVGVPISALTASLGVVAVVVAIALRESLSNLASTVLILLFKPFEVGDLVQADGAVGVVHEIQMLSTVLDAADGKTHIVPNGKIQGGGVTNFSTRGITRVDLTFGVGYGSDLEKAKAILAGLLAADERVLAEPPARVFVQNLADSYIELTAWPFAKREDGSALRAELVEQVMAEYGSAGIDMPYPQQDVHLYTNNRHKS